MWWECSECGCRVRKQRKPSGCSECGIAGSMFRATEQLDHGEPGGGGGFRERWLEYGMSQARGSRLAPVLVGLG